MSISPEVNIKPGLCFFHNGPITITKGAKIGKNCSIGPSVLIGMDFNGKRYGYPTIGDDVYIGNNVTMIGNVKIGNNVFVAPNTFINFDVPDSSIVLGNPGTIHKKKHL